MVVLVAMGAMPLLLSPLVIRWIDLDMPGMVKHPTIDLQLVRPDPLFDLPVAATGPDEFLELPQTGGTLLTRMVHGVTFDEYLRTIDAAQGIGVAFIRALCVPGSVYASGYKRSGPYVVTTVVAYDEEKQVVELSLNPNDNEPVVPPGVLVTAPPGQLPDQIGDCSPALLDTLRDG